MFGLGSKIKEEDVLEALKKVQDPDLHKNLVELNMIKNLKIKGDKVSFDVELTTPACPVKDKIKAESEEAAKSVEGVKEVKVNMTASVAQSPFLDKKMLTEVKHVIAIASGKGGVGKSTVSTNIALSLAATGAKVGIMDADIYGPTIPHLLGVKRAPEVTADKKMIPIEKNGLKIMSLGFLVRGGEPVIWRGPMVSGVIQQFLRDVVWGELDYLIVDLPPGTGDAQLTLCQSIPLSGVAIVSTPEDVSMNIATKALDMFEHMRVPVLGLIENMSYFIAPDTGKKYYIFGEGGGRKMAEKKEVKFLGEIPLDTKIRQGGDSGESVLISSPDSEQAKYLTEVTGNLAASLSTYLLEEE